MNILAIDPGREKCGVAILNLEGILLHQVLMRDELLEFCQMQIKVHEISTIVIGNGTASKKTIKNLQDHLHDVDIVVMDEYRTTDAAKIRYWQANPPRGFKRFVPSGMLVPPVPIDDYAAIILGERYLKNQ